MSFKEFQKAPNRLTPRDVGFIVIAAIVGTLVLVALALGNYYLANVLPDGGEFYLLRTGGRAFLYDRIEPYSGVVPARVQEQMYGRAALPGEDAYILDIPFHLLPIFFPLALFPDALMARAFWMALSGIALAGFIYFSFQSLDRRIPAFFIVLISIASFGSFYTYQAFFEGSSAFLLGLACAGILLSLRKGLDELAGALMVLSSFQWEMGGLFLLLIVLWVIWERRWRVFMGATMLAFIMFMISFFLYPGWVMPFLRATWNNIKVGYGFSLHEILGQVWPEFGSTLGWILTAMLVVLLGYEWAGARGTNPHRFVWVICLTLAATPLLGFRVEMDQLLLLLLPVMLILVVSRERWGRLGNGVAVLLLLFFIGAPWMIFTRGAPQGIGLPDDEVLFLFWPLFTFIGLYWVRWWTIRPPRTWLDQVGKVKQ